jgi:hypothetical protein
MKKNHHNIDQAEKLKRMAASSKAQREQQESSPPIVWQRHTSRPEDIEMLKKMGFSKDKWEIFMEWRKEYVEDFKKTGFLGKLWMLLVALFYILVMPLGVKIAVELTLPRTTLSLFHTYLIAVSIVAIVLFC